VTGRDEQESRVPQRLVSIPRIPESQASVTRRFSMETMGPGGRLASNGRKMDMDRVDETVVLGATEIWEVSNRSMGMMRIPHSFHIHGVQVQILTRNGREPPPSERGWKDTFLLLPGEVVRFIASFGDYTGIYMYHCHLLEHEDDGMMGQFRVTPTR